MTSLEQARKGLTPAQIVGIAAALAVAIGIAAYLAIERPETLQEVVAPQPVAREPAVAKTVAEYDRQYDSDEYCFDEYVYEVRCESSCGSGGEEILPEAAFSDCRPPKRCCKYPPTEWPVFDEDPAEAPAITLEGMEQRCQAEYRGTVCTTDQYCDGNAIPIDGLVCCVGSCVEEEEEEAP